LGRNQAFLPKRLRRGPSRRPSALTHSPLRGYWRKFQRRDPAGPLFPRTVLLAAGSNDRGTAKRRRMRDDRCP
jgi:hypothetical protein